MLTEIRDRSTGLFAWFIAAIIIIPMAFFGVQQYASTEARPTIIEIGDQKITQQEYQARLSQAQSIAREQNPAIANTDVLNSEFYKKQVLQGLVDQTLTSYIASEHNYQVGEKAVDKLIANDPNFQVDGKFDQNLYNVFAASRGPGGSSQIKSDLRAASLRQQVVSGYQESALVLPSEVRELLEIQAEKRTFDLITIKQSDYNDSESVSDTDIADYYNANIDQYMLPDRTSISYVELDRSAIAESLTIEDDRIQELYDEYLEGFIGDETRTASHILLSTDGEKDDDEQKAKIEDLAAQLAGGADFSELAKANSEDPGSAANGGSLGELSREEMIAEFDEVLFSLEQGVVSEPVKTEFGYHLIRVDSINATQADSIEDLRTELEFEERSRLAEDLVVQQAEQLRNVLFEQPDSLDDAAQELGLTVRTTALFSREQGTGVALNDAVRAAAFSEQVQTDLVNSELIETADGVYVALRKLAFAASEPEKLADVSDQVKQTITTERAIAAAKAAGDSVISRAEGNWQSIVDDEEITVTNSVISLIDTVPTVSAEVIREVIKLRLDDASVKVHSFTDSRGDFNVIRLTQIAPGNLAAISQQVKDSTRSLIEQRNGGALYQSYLKGLNEDFADGVNEDLL